MVYNKPIVILLTGKLQFIGKPLAPLIYEGGTARRAKGGVYVIFGLPPASLRSSTPLINAGGKEGAQLYKPQFETNKEALS